MEQPIIYVAGAPDAFPLEYYDREAEAYRGMIPDLLARFGQEYGYDLRYYQPGVEDRREEWARLQQVDIVSASMGNEDLPHAPGGELILMETQLDGQPVIYKLLVTGAAPEGLAEELKSFLTERTQAELTGMLVEAAQREKPANLGAMRIGLFAVSLAAAVLAVTLVVLLLRWRRRIRALDSARETDETTGLGNLDYFIRNYGQYVNERNKPLYGLLYFYTDTELLDRFVGRRKTDDFLREIAIILRNRAKDGDILARVADGGFALLRLTLDEKEEQEWLRPVYDLVAAYREKSEGPVCQRIAVSNYRLRERDLDLNPILFDTAQCAQDAYRNGEEYNVCTAELVSELGVQRQLQTDVKQGLSNHEFELYVRFYTDAQTGKIMGGEALSRWNHPVRGLLMPGYFVPLLERENLVEELDYCCLRNACRFLEGLTWTDRRFFFLTCPFSYATFTAPGFPERCREIIREFDFPREMLLLELRTTAESLNSPDAAHSAAQLKKLGLSIVVDGGEQGIAAFADFLQVPVDAFKIGGKLVAGVGSVSGEGILQAVLDVSRNLGVLTMATGVENDDQREFLRDHGCFMLQRHSSLPLPAWEAHKRLCE